MTSVLSRSEYRSQRGFRLLNRKSISVGLILLALGLFALQPLSYMLSPRGGGVLIPLIVVASLGAALASAQALSHRAFVAAGAAGSATGLFAWGELYANAAVRSLVGDGVPWWTEELAFGLALFAAPAALVSAGVAFALAKRLQAREKG